MSNQSSNARGGIGVFGMLGVLFVGLKLTGIIDWSWFWVTLPFWGGLALVLAIAGLVLLGAVVLTYWEWAADKLRGRKSRSIKR